MPPVRLIVVEDEDTTRQRLVELFRLPDYDICSEASTVSGALQALNQQKPDVALIDLGLPDGNGIEIILAIYQQQLDTLPLVISGFHDEHRVFEALEAGARGYILKHEADDEVMKSVQAILEGGAPVSPAIAKLMLTRFQQPRFTIEALPEKLTERQIQLLKYLSQGFTAKEIAEKLNLSYYTVTTHIKNIYEKLQVNSRIEALIEAKKIGYLND